MEKSNDINSLTKDELKNKQQSFFDAREHDDWRKEWVGMPEYEMKDMQPIQQIIVSFMTFKDVEEFGKLINQVVTPKTKSLWFPKLNLEKPSNYRYVNES